MNYYQSMKTGKIHNIQSTEKTVVIAGVKYESLKIFAK